MNTDTQFEWSDLELELMSLVPKNPPPHLEEDIAERFEIDDLIELPHLAETPTDTEPSPHQEEAIVPMPQSEPETHARRWPIMLAVAAALVAGLFFGLRQLNEHTNFVAHTPTTFSPVNSANQLLAAYDGGIIMGSDETPYRQVHFSFVDDITWESLDGNATVHIAVPREEVVLYPVETL